MNAFATTSKIGFSSRFTSFALRVISVILARARCDTESPLIQCELRTSPTTGLPAVSLSGRELEGGALRHHPARVRPLRRGDDREIARVAAAEVQARRVVLHLARFHVREATVVGVDDQMMGGERGLAADVDDADLADVHHILGRDGYEHADLPVLVRGHVERRNLHDVRCEQARGTERRMQRGRPEPAKWVGTACDRRITGRLLTTSPASARLPARPAAVLTRPSGRIHGAERHRGEDRTGHRRRAPAEHRTGDRAAAGARGRRRRVPRHRAPVRRLPGLRRRRRATSSTRWCARSRRSAGAPLALRADVSSWDEVHAAVAQVARRARRHRPACATSPAAPARAWVSDRSSRSREREWDRVIDVNLKGTWIVARACAERMLAAGRAGASSTSRHRQASADSRCSAPTARPRPASSC